MRAGVFRLSTTHPGDVAALDGPIRERILRALESADMIGITKTQGGLNDFRRDGFTQNLVARLSRLDESAASPARRTPRVLPGGAEHQGPDSGSLLAVIAQRSDPSRSTSCAS